MATVRVNAEEAEWTSAIPFYGAEALYQGKEIVRLKILSDRRSIGGGISWIVQFEPPPGKLIKIIAVALSDEHIYMLEGVRATRSGRPSGAFSGYSLNPKGQPHSAMIASKTSAFVVYAGEPDEIRSIEVMDVTPQGSA